MQTSKMVTIKAILSNAECLKCTYRARLANDDGQEKVASMLINTAADRAQRVEHSAKNSGGTGSSSSIFSSTSTSTTGTAGQQY
jgi:hypothetical protein